MPENQSCPGPRMWLTGCREWRCCHCSPSLTLTRADSRTVGLAPCTVLIPAIRRASHVLGTWMWCLSGEGTSRARLAGEQAFLGHHLSPRPWGNKGLGTSVLRPTDKLVPPVARWRRNKLLSSDSLWKEAALLGFNGISFYPSLD